MEQRPKLAYRTSKRNLNALTLSDVTTEGGSANDLSVPVAQRCNRQFYLDGCTVLSQPDRFVLSKRFTLSYARNDVFSLGSLGRRDDL
jgi:hypothetical protein